MISIFALLANAPFLENWYIKHNLSVNKLLIKISRGPNDANNSGM
jgi:hypothetical protein